MATMLPQVPNYLPQGGGIDPFGSLLQGAQIGAQFTAIQQQQQAREQALRQQEELNTLMGALASNPNARVEEYQRAAMLMPKEQGKLLLDFYNARTEGQRNELMSFSGKLMAAAKSSPEVAIRLLRERAAGERNGGREAEAKAWDTWAGLVENDPAGVRATVGTMIATLPGGDKVLKALTEAEPQKVPEPAEVATMRTLGFPMTPQGYSDFRASQMKEPSTELTTLLAELEKAPPGSTKARVLQRRVDMLTSREPRAPSEGPAPTITQIQDPTNPERMITIDARRYQGGGVGSVGVIGTTGKTAPAEAAAIKRQEGASQVRDILDTLRTAYEDLDRRRALPSEQRGAVSNALAWVASTGPGQTVGRMAGTKEQTLRDVVSSARNQLLVAAKNATGMSAQQLNSNVEFRSWLDSLTDPTRSYQANIAILDNMERFIASGGKEGMRSRGPVTPAPAAPAPAPKPAAAPYSNMSNDELLRRLRGQ